MKQNLKDAPMDHAELRAAVTEYFRAQLNTAKKRRAKLGPFSAEERDRAEFGIGLYEEPNHDYWSLMGREHAEEELAKFFDATGLSREQYWPHAMKVLDEIRKGKIAASKAILAYGETLERYDFSEAQSAPLEAFEANSGHEAAERITGSQEAAQATSGPILSELFRARRNEAERGAEWSVKITEDYQVWVDLFTELRGDRSILDYQKADARAFKAVLQELPTNRNKLAETKGLGALEAVEAGNQHELPVISTSTVNKALGRLQAVWKWADRQLDEEVPDIFGPMKVTKRNGAREERDPFSAEQLQAIFGGPLFTGCKSTRFRAKAGNTNMSSTSWFWLPLLGLFTGARLNELCQLRVEDVREDEGIPFLFIREGDEAQRVKGGKKRAVPIHPQLVDIGFLRYVSSQQGAGEERVFPTLQLGATGYYSDRASKDFAAYLRAIGAKTDKTSFHSFRHCVKDALRNGGVSEGINDILLGHSLHGMGARYGEGRVTPALLYEAVCKIDYKGLSLGAVKRHP